MDRNTARADLDYLEVLLARVRACVDPHAFHYVHWGAIVLFWYPLANVALLAERAEWAIAVSVAAVVLGTAMSVIRELRLRSHPRLVGEDARLGRRVALIALGNVGCGTMLSILGPATGLVHGEDVPIVWGLVYASLAFHTGVVHHVSFVWSGAAILVGVVVASALQPYQGLVLGPFMGLGMIVPGLMAEQRVRRLRSESSEGVGGGV